MFFRKDPPQTEGRRHAHPLIKTGPVFVSVLNKSSLIQVSICGAREEGGSDPRPSLAKSMCLVATPPWERCVPAPVRATRPPLSTAP